MRLRLAMVVGMCLAVLALGSARGAEPAAPAAAVAAPAAAATSPEPPLTPEEKVEAEIGKKAAEGIDKEIKLLDKYPGLPHVQEVIEKIRPFTEKPYQKYSVKIIDSRAVNAFSLPGGYLYFTKGLLEAVESDDELAAVAGHEMAHVCLSHSRKVMERDERYNKILAPIVMAAILGQKGSGINAGEVATIGNLVKTDVVNRYGREAETEADRDAVHYLHTSKIYNPVAMLTVTEGLARIEQAAPGPDPGVFQTHPYAKERVAAVLAQLRELKVPVERGRVQKGLVVVAGPMTVEGTEIGEIRLGEQVVFRPAVEADRLSPVARAQRCAELLNPMLLTGIELIDFSTATRGEAVVVLARGEILFTITPEDAAFHKSTVEGLSQQAMRAIQLAFYGEGVRRAY